MFGRQTLLIGCQIICKHTRKSWTTGWDKIRTLSILGRKQDLSPSLWLRSSSAQLLRLPLSSLTGQCYCSCSSVRNANGPRKDEDQEFIRNLPQYKGLYYHYDPLIMEQEVQHPAAKAFIKLSHSSPDSRVSDPKYGDVVLPTIASREEYTEQELQHVLYCMGLFPSPEKEFKDEYSRVWEALDEECVQRGVDRKRWRSNIHFVYADLWSNLLLGKYSSFHWIYLRICFKKVDTLTREKYVRLCQQMLKARRLPQECKMYNLEYNVERVIQDSEVNGGPISLQELAVICTVFYKMKVGFNYPKTPMDIMEMAMKHSKTISNTSLAGISLGLSISRRLQIEEKVDQFLTTFTPEVSRLNSHAIACLLILAKQSRVRNVEFLSRVDKRLEELKDCPNEFGNHHIDWILMAYRELGVPSSSVFKTLYSVLMDRAVKKVERVQTQNQSESSDSDSDSKGTDVEGKSSDIKTDIANTSLEKVLGGQYGGRLPSILTCLAYGGIYPKSIFSYAMSPEFLRSIYDKSMHGYGPDILWTDHSVDEIPDYNGHRLSDKARGFLTKKHMNWVSPPEKERVSQYEKMVRHIWEILVSAFGVTGHAFMCNIIPIYNTIEIVFCTKESGSLVPIPESYMSKESYETKSLTPEDLAGGLQYHAMLMYHWDKVVYPTGEPSGAVSKMKGKVEKLGYNTYELSYLKYRAMSPDQVQDYVLSILDEGKVPIKFPVASATLNSRN